jgi:hypothetical protein
MRNGVLLMGGAAMAALFYTRGDVGRLVVMYSINVFLTFSLSEFGMPKFWIQHRKEHPREWKRHLPVHLTGLTLCLTILTVTVIEKFAEGGWITLLITGCVLGLCFLIKRHYNLVIKALRQLDVDLPSPDEIVGSVESSAATEYQALPGSPLQAPPAHGEPPADQPVAILFVGGYSGLGRHALLTLLRMFPRHFKGVVFVSIAVVDSDVFKGEGQVEELKKRTEEHLRRYESFGRALGLASSSAYAIGTEVAVEAEKLGAELFQKHHEALFVAGQLIFENDTFWNRTLHNETAFIIQRRLQHVGVPMVVLPVRLDLKRGRAVRRPPPPACCVDLASAVSDVPPYRIMLGPMLSLGRRVFFATLGAILILGSSGGAGAAEPKPIPQPVAVDLVRLGAELDLCAAEARRTRWATAVTGLAIGSALVPTGIILLGRTDGVPQALVIGMIVRRVPHSCSPCRSASSRRGWMTFARNSRNVWRRTPAATTRSARSRATGETLPSRVGASASTSAGRY